MYQVILRKLKFISPTRMIILGFLTLIVIGTILLILPVSSANHTFTNGLDALFTATSSVCVTGLVVVDTTTHWSAFGKTVILILIQIGGLGFMTFVTLGFMMLKKQITLKDRLLIKESYNQTSMQGMVRFVRRIFIGTMVIEGIGVIFLTLRFSFDYPFMESLVYGIFHSISAFCNAGFDILPGDSLVPYATDFIINATIMLLIIIGGLGFPVWMDTYQIIQTKKQNRLPWKVMLRRLSLHSKIVYTVTPILILLGTIIFFTCEYSNPLTMRDMSIGDKTITSLFQSVTSRTAGFNTISQGGMTDASKFMTMILMVIGGSPGGTAGGIKTVTISILLIAVLSVIRGSRQTHIFERKIPFETLQKALAVFFISFLTIIVMTMILTFTENDIIVNHQFMDILFEVTSALGTVGVTTGITPYLSTAGRILIIIAMFIGRIGPITLVMGLTKKQHQTKNNIEYVEGQLIVG